ncbi:HAD family hydrolase [Wocania ichthyoenteri]|uniref:HAD family hydrolase n=1 Tax=Wocania ichthyoenteri TaxID=1230531 RepID=UPI00053D28D3|nr:HAD family hydrolase [Wocania ichthyoenteri]
MKINTVVVFDLDDTLYNEIDFLKSAYTEISLKIGKVVSVESSVIYNQMLACFYDKENAFEAIIKIHNLSISINELLDIYRNHNPKLELSKDRVEVLNELKRRGIVIGLITDGRSKQQRSKIDALKLNNWVSEVLISEEFGSEKPNVNNYKHFENLFENANYYYIGDNVKKDFITPNKLGWTTICLKDSGQNIHKQNSSLLGKEYLAKYTVSSFKNILDLIFY